ncbi:MAG: valine--tRNA ligase, partial [Clostridiales bacterium]|nr:valine--tRNA ligase [Candidatus Apopatousia equi]
RIMAEENKEVKPILDGKYNFQENEKKWQDYWQENQIYKFEENTNKQVYSIDTPPPTVNGKIHMGHLSSYMHIETIARHHRMKGENVYFPFGFDDNGLPTERYVEKTHKVRAHEMPRQDFINLCLDTTRELEKEFHGLYKSAGFSCELGNTYSSISKNTQKISQQSFLELYKKGYIYHAESPALWCTECRTAVAQSELEDKDLESTFNYIKFYIEGTKDYVVVATTRPEMLPACDCVFINPDDKKNAYLIGKNLVVPHFNFTVPVLTDELVDMEKGSGIVMCCTFGDTVDKEWQRKHNLPIKEAFNNAGRMNEIAGEFAGMKIVEARLAIIEKLEEEDLLIKQESLTHAVSTHERCGTPIEIAVKKQWFIDVLSHKQELLDAGYKLNWHPEAMRARYINWVENLQWNWCISRQRYYGVPFPVWYCKNCGKVVMANVEDLPVDPMVDKPKCACECGCTEFEGETDVMDTWATSSLTPQISTDLYTKQGLSDSMVPMNLRPNAHDNIRVWDFYTVVKSLYHFGKLPWKDLMISGYVTSPDGSKLSKKSGNDKNSPQQILDNYSADVTRYWANSLSLGKDTAFSLIPFDSGKKLVNKLWNASKFVLSFLNGYEPKQVKLLPVDRWILEEYNVLYKSFIKHLDNYEIALSLNEVERFFWNFCDNYIEIVKRRLYNPDTFGKEAQESGQFACYNVLLGILKMFGVFMPFITEEIYSAYFAKIENKKSLHISGYLDLSNVLENIEEVDKKLHLESGKILTQIVSDVRGYKSENKLSLKTIISKLTITVPKANLDFVKATEQDMFGVCGVNEIEYKEGDYNLEFGEIVPDEI